MVCRSCVSNPGALCEECSTRSFRLHVEVWRCRQLLKQWERYAMASKTAVPRHARGQRLLNEAQPHLEDAIGTLGVDDDKLAHFVQTLGLRHRRWKQSRLEDALAFLDRIWGKEDDMLPIPITLPAKLLQREIRAYLVHDDRTGFVPGFEVELATTSQLGAELEALRVAGYEDFEEVWEALKVAIRVWDSFRGSAVGEYEAACRKVDRARYAYLKTGR